MAADKRAWERHRKEMEADRDSDSVAAMKNAKRIRPKEEAAKKKAAQARLKPIDPKEISDVNEKILICEDAIDELKDKIGSIKTDAGVLRSKRKELMDGLKAQKRPADDSEQLDKSVSQTKTPPEGKGGADDKGAKK
jgi:hypothetical protein